MKRSNKFSWLFACLLFCSISQPVFSQTLKDVFTNSESPLVYLGIDFSKTRFLDQGNASDIRDRYYVSINDLIINEFKKFDIKGAFRKSNIENYISAVAEKNAKANMAEIISSNSADFNRFTENDIMAAVKGLNIKGKEGIGFVFIVEAMRKIDKRGDAAIWATLIDLKTKKVLLTARIESKATGIGFRNYWASTIKETIDEIDKHKFKEWKNTYGN